MCNSLNRECISKIKQSLTGRFQNLSENRYEYFLSVLCHINHIKHNNHFQGNTLQKPPLKKPYVPTTSDYDYDDIELSTLTR